MDFESDATTLAKVEGYGTDATETFGLSICEAVCSSVLDYLHDTGTNLLTSVDT